VSNGGGPRGVVGRQRADTTLRREGRALSVLASWRAVTTGWDVSWSLAAGWTTGGSFDTRWSLLAACRFLACR